MHYYATGHPCEGGHRGAWDWEDHGKAPRARGLGGDGLYNLPSPEHFQPQQGTFQTCAVPVGNGYYQYSASTLGKVLKGHAIANYRPHGTPAPEGRGYRS